MFTVHQHWNPLKVCAVGRSYPPEFYSYIENPKVRSVFERIAIETEEDYQKIIAKLEEFGVTVVRTDISDNFEDHLQPSGLRYYPPPMCPRDHTAMVGDTFYMPGKEYGNFNINQLAEKYFPEEVRKQGSLSVLKGISEGKSFLLTAKMLEDAIQAECQTIGSNVKYPNNKNHYAFESIKKFLEEHNVPIVYDEYINTASMTRLGKDLYFSGVNVVGLKNPDVFIEKSKRLFPDYRAHVLGINGHSDGAFCPVKPGLIISFVGKENYYDTFPGWEIVEVFGEGWEKVQPFLDLKAKNRGKWWVPGEELNDDFTDYVETWMDDWVTYVEETVFDVNMLVIDEKNVICNGYNEKVFDAFERHGVTPHVINFRHRYFWDGGIHCITSDIAREGERVDFFPNRKGSSAILHPTPGSMILKSW